MMNDIRVTITTKRGYEQQLQEIFDDCGYSTKYTLFQRSFTFDRCNGGEARRILDIMFASQRSQEFLHSFECSWHDTSVSEENS